MGALTLADVNYTYKDYQQWDGNWELFDGVPLAMSPAPTLTHQRLQSEIIRLLGNQLEECQQCQVLGEVDYKISEETVVRPDVVVTCGETGEAYLTKAPEIIVEILSPSTIKRDEVFKFDLYEKERVLYYILVYPNDLKAKLYKLDGKSYLKQGDFLNQSYTFEDLPCPISLDFEKVFQRFR